AERALQLGAIRQPARPGFRFGLNRLGVLEPPLDQGRTSAMSHVHREGHGQVPSRPRWRSPGSRGGRCRLALNRGPAARGESAGESHLARRGTRGPLRLTAVFCLLWTATLPLIFLHDRLLGAADRTDM